MENMYEELINNIPLKDSDGRKMRIKDLVYDSNFDYKNKSDKKDYDIESILQNFLTKEKKEIDKIRKTCKRRQDLEDILQSYGDKFEEIFSLVGLKPIYVDVYQIMEGKKDLVSCLNNEEMKGIYIRDKDKESLDAVALLNRKSILLTSLYSEEDLDYMERMIVVHENIHHNLSAYARLIKDDEDAVPFVNEGFTEFLTSLVMGEDYCRERFKNNNPERFLLFHYIKGKEMFEAIYNKLGLEGAFEAYTQSKTTEHLLFFMNKHKIDYNFSGE